MKGWVKIVVFLIIPVTASLLILGGVFTSKIKPGEVAAESGKEVRDVTIAEVSKMSSPIEITAPGTVVTKEETIISSKLMAPVQKILVTKGMTVKQGQPLVLLDSSQVTAQANQAKAGISTAEAAQQGVEASIKLAEAGVQQAQSTIKQANSGVKQAQSMVQQAVTGVKDAQARYENTKNTYNRISELYRNGAVSKQEYENEKTAYETAKISVDKAQAVLEQARAGAKSAEAALGQAYSGLSQANASVEAAKAKRGEVGAQIQGATAGYDVANVSVADATIRAPFDGIIVDTHVNNGNMATPGLPLLTMEQQPYYLETYVDERKKSQVSIGSKIPVFIDAFKQTYTGTVTEITPHVEQDSRKFRVKILLPEQKGLMTGMFGTASFPDGGEAGLFIPQSAVLHWSQFTGVYVVDQQNIAHLRYVSVGRTHGNQIEVLSGLQVGEKIVTSSIDRVTDKARVVGTK